MSLLCAFLATRVELRKMTKGEYIAVLFAVPPQAMRQKLKLLKARSQTIDTNNCRQEEDEDMPHFTSWATM